MNEQQEQQLAAGLKALAASTSDTSASPAIEAALMAAMRQAQGRRSTDASIRLLPIAAALLLAVGGALWTAQREQSSARPQAIHPAGFVPLPYSAALPEMESASIIRVSLPVSALPVYGVAITPDTTGSSVEAELLVAQDGQAHAIRLVPNDSRSGSDD